MPIYFNIKQGNKIFGLLHILDLLILSTLFGPIVLSIVGKTPGLFFSDIVSIFILIAFFIAIFSHRRILLLRLPKFIFWMGIYILAIIMSIPKSEYILGTIAIAKLYIMPILVFFIAYQNIHSLKEVEHLLLTISLVGLYFGATALYNWWRYDVGLAVLDSAYSVKDMIQTVTGRSNTVAGINALLVPISVYTFLNKQKVVKFIGGLSLIFLIVSIFFSISRASIIALGFGFLFWLCVLIKNKFTIRPVRKSLFVTIFAVVAVVVMAWFLLPDSLKQLFLTRFDDAIYKVRFNPESDLRLMRWHTSFNYFFVNPFGIGVGNYKSIMSNMNSSMGDSMHNFYLEILIETGIIGFLGLLGFLFGYGSSLVRFYRSTTSVNERLLATSFISVYIIFLINVFLEPNYYSPTFMCLFSIIMAMGCALNRIKSSLKRY